MKVRKVLHGLLVLLATLGVGAALIAMANGPSGANQDTAQQRNRDGTASSSLPHAATTTIPRKLAPFPPVRAPSTFVAFRSIPGGPVQPSAVTVNNATTGTFEHTVLPIPWKGMEPDATAVDRRGRVWVTLNKGPECSSDVLGCGPKAGTCASEVVRVDPLSGVVTPVLIGSDNELIQDAQPSPNGTFLAYLDATCNRSVLDSYLVVRDLSTGRSWTIGKDLTVCHFLGTIAWSLDGSNLAVAYGPSSLPQGTDTEREGYGDCQSPQPKELAVVPATKPAPGLPGRQVSMGPNCQADSVTATKSGFAVLEACGATTLGYRTGPASLVRYDSALHLTSRLSIGHCLGTTDSALSADPSGTDLLGFTVQSCNPLTYPQPKVTPPLYTVLFTDTRRGLHIAIDLKQVRASARIVYDVSW